MKVLERLLLAHLNKQVKTSQDSQQFAYHPGFGARCTLACLGCSLPLTPPRCSLLHPPVGASWFLGCITGGTGEGAGPLWLAVWRGSVLLVIGWGL